MLCLILHCEGPENQSTVSLTVRCLISVIKLAEHGHTALDPVFRAPASGQHHGNDKIGGVACGREGALPLTGLVERTLKQLLWLIEVLLLSYMEEKEEKKL